MESSRRSIFVAPESEADELRFELDYLRSLTFDQRLAMVRERSTEMLRRMIERGHRKPLRSLSDHKVDYVIIGATAFPHHGYARATLDIDIFIRPTAENAERALAALRDFGYDVQDLSAETLRLKKVLIRSSTLRSTT